MQGIEGIEKICKKNNVSVHRLEIILGYGNGSLKKNNSIKFDRMVEIADYFGVSLDELAGRETAGSPTAAEREILELFRHLNEEGRTAAVKQVQFLAQQPEYAGVRGSASDRPVEEIAG